MRKLVSIRTIIRGFSFKTISNKFLLKGGIDGI